MRAFPPAKLEDPTGAGDSYMAGFVRAIELYTDPVNRGEFAAMTATLAIEQQCPFIGSVEAVCRRLDDAKGAR